MYKLIIMDLKLDNKDGLETTKEILSFIQSVNQESIAKGNEAVLQRPYICILSAYCSAKVKKKALQIGFDLVLSKPIFKLDV